MSDLMNIQDLQQNMSGGRKFIIFFNWTFPFILAAAAYLIGTHYEPASSLRTSIMSWPVSQSVYLWLLVFVLIAIVWLVSEFIFVANRETVVTALQYDLAISTIIAFMFTGYGGWLLGNDRIEWWFIVPWAATIIDALTGGWLSINNAAQKPFLSKRGTF